MHHAVTRHFATFGLHQPFASPACFKLQFLQEHARNATAIRTGYRMVAPNWCFSHSQRVTPQILDQRCAPFLQRMPWLHPWAEVNGPYQGHEVKHLPAQEAPASRVPQQKLVGGHLRHRCQEALVRPCSC